MKYFINNTTSIDKTITLPSAAKNKNRKITIANASGVKISLSRYLIFLLLLFVGLKAQSQIARPEGAGPGSAGATAPNISLGSRLYTGGRLYLMVVFERFASADPGAPTVTGTGTTWNIVDTKRYNTVGTPLSRVSVFRFLPSANVTSNVTCSHASGTGAIGYLLMGFTGMQATGTNGEDAIRQSATGSGDASTTTAVTGAPFDGSGTSAGIYVTATPSAASGISTPEAGWTEVSEGGFSNNFVAVNQAIPTTDNTATSTLSSALNWGGILIEIRKAFTRRVMPVQ